jgi:hypothetical protein
MIIEDYARKSRSPIVAVVQEVIYYDRQEDDIDPHSD